MDWPRVEVNDMSGPFLHLLWCLFPLAENHMVTPMPRETRYTDDGTTPTETMCFTVHKDSVPILVLHIKSYNSFNNARASADEHIREDLSSYTGSRANKVIGVSFFGPKFRVYELSTSTGIITPESAGVPSVDKWDFDLLDDEGEKRLWDISSQ